MNNVVFKVKYNNPNHKIKTPMLNKNHLIYIAKRPNSVHNSNKAYCAFGKISALGYNEFGDINNLNRVINHVEDISKKSTTVYKAVISLEESDAVKLEYDTKEKWQQLLKNNIKDIAYNFDIKNENIEYVASFHLEKGHPHIHVMFWDKNQEQYRGRIPKEKLSDTIKKLNRYVFSDDMQSLFDEKEDYKKRYREQTKSILDNFEELYNEESRSKKDERLSTLELKDKMRIYKLFESLVATVPKKGRLNYGFMSKEIKQKLDEFTDELIRNNVDLNQYYQGYMNVCDQLNKMGVGLEHDYKEDIYNQLGNITLKSIKKILNESMEAKKMGAGKESWESTDKDIGYQKASANQLAEIIVGFSRLLTAKRQKNNKTLDNVRELSKQAKKEFAIKRQHASQIEWGDRER